MVHIFVPEFENKILKSRKYWGYTNVLKIDLKCPEKYLKAYIFFIIQWIEFKFENLKYISIYMYVTIIVKKIKKR